jgi:hypothetical protein
LINRDQLNLNEEVKLEAIKCLRIIFTKEPLLVLKAYETGFDFQVFIEAVRDGDPEIALAGIEFWHSFIMLDKVVFRDDFKKRLFDQ